MSNGMIVLTDDRDRVEVSIERAVSVLDRIAITASLGGQFSSDDMGKAMCDHIERDAQDLKTALQGLLTTTERQSALDAWLSGKGAS